MADDGTDDLREWLAEVATTDPFERLRRFRAENPAAPIPGDLKFAAQFAPIVNEDENRIDFNEVLAEQVDNLIAEDEASKGGGSYREWRPGAFARIDDLTRDGDMSLEEAIDTVLDDLANEGKYDNLARSYHRHAAKTLISQIGTAIADSDNLARSYHRHAAKTLISQIGTAIAEGDQDTAVELLRELRRRHNTFGRRWPA